MAQPTTARKSGSQPARKPGTPEPRKDSNRDLIEQIVVAFILAFLIRGFEAEAFVIPTGSMAPTLMGRHKEITCPQCGHVYRVNAADEVEGSGRRVVEGTCDNCRYRAEDLADAPSFKGDRILVMKFLYSLPFLPGGGGPDRWDVVVFHYPEDPETNYIKRLVGMPGEELRVHHGDILTRPLGADEPFRYRRRPLEHQQAMQMMVFDDAHRPEAFGELPEWRRWRSKTPGAWDEQDAGTYLARADAAGWSELRYRHLVPDPIQWRQVLDGAEPSTPPRATLITDYYSYNTSEAFRRGDEAAWFEPLWVGDLTLSCRLQAESSSGTVRLELVEGGVPNHCEIDLATGLATLYHGGRPLGEPAQTGIHDRQGHDVTFANVDDRLTLWVDGRTPFGDGLSYNDGSDDRPGPTADDLDPAGIAARGASVRVSGLVLKRDIYYTLVPGDPDYEGVVRLPSGRTAEGVLELFDFLSDPRRFSVLGQLRPRDFTIRPGHYMMMGDNSPRSRDSRGWDRHDQSEYGGWDENYRASWEVPEKLLIGKAFFVYWPHGKPVGPDIRLSQDFRLPFRPYFERMKWIR